MGSRTLLLFILVIGMLALAVYMTMRVYVPQVSTLPSTVADSTGIRTPGATAGPETIDRARRDMEAMQNAARNAQQQARPPEMP